MSDSFARVDEQFARIDMRLFGIEGRLTSFEENLRKELQDLEDRTASLIAAEVGNLHTEIEALRSETRGALKRIDERLDRQGFMLSGGTQALGGLLEHVNNVESNYSRVLTEMGELRARLDRLEKAS